MLKSQFENLLNAWIDSIIYQSAPREWHPVLEQAKNNPGTDVLGEFYEKEVCSRYTSRRENEQIFTPVEIVRFMNEATITMFQMQFPDAVMDVQDPCCGSGRFAMDMVSRGYRENITCTDIDLVCVKMTALNLWMMRPIQAVVINGDTLSDQWQYRYLINHTIRILKNKKEANKLTA